MKQAMQFALRGYKRWISPMLPHACRFVPTCSEYAMEAIERHGAARGSLLAVARVLRCHPLARAGYDPVPPTVEGQGFSPAANDLKNAGLQPRSPWLKPIFNTYRFAGLKPGASTPSAERN